MVAAALRLVLIVDDSVSLAENIAKVPQIDGHTAHVAASAEEAFPTGREEKPDVLMTDCRLPGISGAAFVKQIRSVHSWVRALVISAGADPTTVDAVAETGATFMPEPLDLTLFGRWVGEGPPSA